MTRYVILLCVALLSSGLARADEGFDQLRKQAAQARKDYMRAFNNASKSTGNDTTTIDSSKLPGDPMQAFVEKFKQYADAHQSQPEAVDALIEIIEHPATIVTSDPRPSVRWAVERLTRDHATDPRMKGIIQNLTVEWRMAGRDPVMHLFEAIARSNPEPAVAEEARMAIPAVPYWEGFCYGPEAPSAAAEKSMAEAREGFMSIIEASPDSRIASRAKRYVFEIDHLQVGMTAPDFAGRDADGRTLRLSDFRGKVVVVYFWSTACGPCMASMPRKNQLVADRKDKPFALIGIDSNEKVEDLKTALTDNRITWPNIFDGRSNTGPIFQQWNVIGWPTIYVLDRDGVIRYRNRVSDLEGAVDDLLRAMPGDRQGRQP